MKSASEMPVAVKEASSQMLQQKYDSFLKYHGYTNCLRYAIALHDKRGMIRRV